MAFKLDMGSWNNVFAVPRDFLTQHIKLCSENELKFILWLFANPDSYYDNEKISKETGIPVTSIDDCTQYWIQAKLLKRVDSKLVASEKTSEISKTPEITESPKNLAQNTVMRKMLRPDGIYIAKRLKESSTLSHLFSDVESIMGKMLTPSLCAVLLNAHDDYCLPSEVIMILISYCVSIEKFSTSYIETLTRKWYQNGINTLRLAEEEINSLDQKNSSWKKLISILGIPYRKPIKSEEELAIFAIIEAKFSDEMIKICYEKCIQGTGKFQAKYMLKIFTSWHNKNISNIQELERAEHNKPKAKKDVTAESSYDINEFYRLNVFNIEED